MNSLEVGENLVFCSISSSWVIPDFRLVCLQEANSSTKFFPGRFCFRNAVKRAAILAVDIIVHGLN